MIRNWSSPSPKNPRCTCCIYKQSTEDSGIALIWADLVLPIPQTAVIAALGIIYGTLIGGLLGSCTSSEPVGQVGRGNKRELSSSELGFRLPPGDAAIVVAR